MNLQEFQKRVDKAETDLTITVANGDNYYDGVCTAVFKIQQHYMVYSRLDESPIVNAFTELLEPKDSDKAYWLGDLTEEFLPLRKAKLREFERHCIKNKLYEGWE